MPRSCEKLACSLLVLLLSSRQAAEGLGEALPNILRTRTRLVQTAAKLKGRSDDDAVACPGSK